MRLILLFTFLLMGFVGKSQNDTTKYYKSLDYGWNYQRLKARAAMVLPSDTVTNKLGVVTIDTNLFVGNGVRWAKVGSNTVTIDTTSLSNRINQKLSISDSATYYTKYRSDTSRDNIYAAIAATSDTASVVKALVHNQETTTLTRGTVVYLYGASGNVASVKRAYNTSDSFSSKTFAIVKDDIAAGQRGIVITQGVVDKLNLGAFTQGDILWLDSIPGQVTKVKPFAPYHEVFIGVVQRANNGNGQLYIKVQNGYELQELHNVSVNGQADNDVLYYQASTKLWKAKSPYQLVDTTQLSNRINTKLNSTDTASLSNRINTKLNSTDTASLSNRINTKLNSIDTVSLSNRINTKLNSIDTLILSNRINTKLNSSDSTIYQTKFRSDTARINTWSQFAQELNISDSNTYQTKFRSDTARTNIYSSLFGKQNTLTFSTGLTNTTNTITNNLSIGVSGGQSVIGGNASGNNLTLSSTSNATKGRISFGTSAYDEANNRLGIGLNNPSVAMEVQGSIASTAGNIVVMRNTNASLTTSPVLALDCSATGADQPVDIRLGSTNPKGLRIYASNADLAQVGPAGAGFQFFSTSSTNFPGQVYFDGGAHNSSAIIFRTAQAGNSVAQRMRIFANGNINIGSTTTDAGYLLNVQGTVRSTQFFLSALNTAPASATSAGTLGEIRIDANFIYICTATNTWKRVAISTW